MAYLDLEGAKRMIRRLAPGYADGETKLADRWIDGKPLWRRVVRCTREELEEIKMPVTELFANDPADIERYRYQYSLKNALQALKGVGTVVEISGVMQNDSLIQAVNCCRRLGLADDWGCGVVIQPPATILFYTGVRQLTSETQNFELRLILLYTKT